MSFTLEAKLSISQGTANEKRYMILVNFNKPRRFLFLSERRSFIWENSSRSPEAFSTNEDLILFFDLEAMVRIILTKICQWAKIIPAEIEEYIVFKALNFQVPPASVLLRDISKQANNGGSMQASITGIRGKILAYLLVVIPLLLLGKFSLANENFWPKTILTGSSTIVVYQPQYQSLESDLLKAQGVISLKSGAESEPVFGAVWMDIHLDIDQENQTARFVSAQIKDFRFSQDAKLPIADLPKILSQEFSQWDISMDLQSLNAQLAIAKIQRQTAKNLNVLPPKIIFRSQPTILINFDGDPEWRPVQQSPLMRAVNTPSLVVFDPQSKSFFFDSGNTWLQAKELTGPWKNALKVPEDLKNLQASDTEERSLRPASFNNSRSDQVLIATEPTELIVTQGEPSYQFLEGNDLLYMSNTVSDVLLDIHSQRYFVLLSGRWYSSWSLNGPWTYEHSDRLPESFKKISPSSKKRHLLVHISGSQQAQDAFREAQIPKMASVRRQDARLHILYDGEPKFVPIEGTVLQYALNADAPVVELRRHYYAVKDGIWYEAENPNGPWILSDSIPNEIQSLPPDCPIYHVKFVRVYDSTPDQVLVGYTSGYLGSYNFYGNLVYGTGFHYRPWYGHYNFFWPWTWGLRVHYSLGYGWSFGFGFGFPSNHFNHRHIYYHDHNHHHHHRYATWRDNHGGWWGPTRVGIHRGDRHLHDARTESTRFGNVLIDKQSHRIREYPRHRGNRPISPERKNYFSDRSNHQAARDRGFIESGHSAILSRSTKPHRTNKRSFRDRFNRRDRIGPESNTDFAKHLRDARTPGFHKKGFSDSKLSRRNRGRDGTRHLNRSFPRGRSNRDFNKEFRRHQSPLGARDPSLSGSNYSPQLKSRSSRKSFNRSFFSVAPKSRRSSRKFESPMASFDQRSFSGNGRRSFRNPKRFSSSASQHTFKKGRGFNRHSGPGISRKSFSNKSYSGLHRGSGGGSKGFSRSHHRGRGRGRR